jgi:hypothetical protein
MRSFNLVVPLASAIGEATAMRTTDTAGQLSLFGQAEHSHGSGAVFPLIGAAPATCADLRQGDLDSTIECSRATTATGLGRRTSPTAIRTTTTRTTSFAPSPSADENGAFHADFSLEEVVHAYLCCRRNKRTKDAARAFEHHQEALLFEIFQALREGTYQPERAICFVVTRPKPREVWRSTFRDRVIHHVYYNRVAPRFVASFIADTCASIPGRGTLYAAERLEHHVRSCSRNWGRRVFYLKCDLANFFVTIHKPTLRGLLAKRIHEPWLMELGDRILFHDPREGALMHSSPAMMALVPPHKSLLNQPAELGLPIGNLSSQFFSNVYLDVLDQFVKHRLRCRHYVRYVDDFILVHESAQWLNEAKEQIEQLLAERLRAKLNIGKTILQPVERGADFVGQVLKPWYRRLRRRTSHQALARVAQIDAADLFTTANSYFGLLTQATHSHHDRARLANVVRARGHAVNRDLTKTYRGTSR